MKTQPKTETKKIKYTMPELEQVQKDFDVFMEKANEFIVRYKARGN